MNAPQIPANPPRPSVIQLAIKEKGALYAAYIPLFAEGGIFIPTSREYRLGDDVYDVDSSGDRVQEATNEGHDRVRTSLESYTLLANVFASHGMWHETANVRKIMRASKTKKAPGFSQIEVSMRNHVFYSRDQEHPQCAEIYEMLNDTIIPQMKGSPCTGFWVHALQSDPTIY